MFEIINGNCLDELDKLDECSIDCIITDPPYELNFMGKGWDNAGISFNKGTWQKCLRVLKPGGYLLAFGGTRTYHRIACAIEDAGFEIRDCIMWLYGSGFPKSMNIGLAVDKKLGNESKIIGEGRSEGTSRAYQSAETTTAGAYQLKEAQNEWKGWGTALKPAYEPIIVARKSFKGSLVDNVLKNGVGGLNIDECRVETGDIIAKNIAFKDEKQSDGWGTKKCITEPSEQGRFPANIILTYNETDFDEVCGGFPNTKGGGKVKEKGTYGYCFGKDRSDKPMADGYEDNGSAARYFYCAKASKKDRDEGLEEFEKDITDDGRNIPIDNPYLRGKTMRHNTHPTVKPTNLMQYLIRLVAPKDAIILDPFMGSGSTGKAVMYENKEHNMNYKFIGVEKDSDYCKIAEARIKFAGGEE
jgi:site-specific DNA-methyltransferase (adenine-specific)